MQHERTFIAVKSDAIQRHLAGEIIKRFENRGLKLVAIKMLVPTEEQLSKQYPDTKEWKESVGNKTIASKKVKGEDETRSAIEIGEWVRNMILKDVVGKPLIGMVWEGPHAVALGRKTAGATNPLDADVGTIRGDYTVESYALADLLGHPIRNLLHASGDVEEAKEDIATYFDANEIIDYRLIVETVLYEDGWGWCKTQN